MRNALFLIPLLWLVAGCQSDTLYQKEVTLPESGWTRNEPVSYEFEIQDTSIFYELMLDVEAKDVYRYQNLYINIHTQFPDGKLEKDIVSLEMGTPGGKWHGKCSAGTCKVPIQLQQKFRFPIKGDYKINLHQFTRMDTIKDLSSLRLSINKVVE